MLDAHADICRRAWVACDSCGEYESCRHCLRGRTCPVHWCYLLDSAARWLFVQCASCHRRWWHDTRFGVGDRPSDLDALPAVPEHGHDGWSSGASA